MPYRRVRVSEGTIVDTNTRTALITGASSGIGYELARLFARDRYDLVLVAKSQQRLELTTGELSREFGVRIQAISKDLSLPEAPEDVAAALKGRTRIDVLINDAGFATFGPFLEIPADVELEMMQLNMMALTRLSKLFAPEMVARRSGKILNVASTAAFMPGPLMAVYYASKAYVLSFSQALACELAPSGVGVSVLCPGPTHTGFQRRAKMERSKVFDSGVMDARSVARAGYRGLMQNKTVIIPGVRNKLTALFAKAAPRGLMPRLVLEFQKPHGDIAAR
jgi:short-subunit dehydrogenase